MTCNLIRKKIGLKFAIFASVLFFSKDLILQSTIGMESGLVIFISSLIFYLLLKEFDFNSKDKKPSLGGNNKFKETIFFTLGILSVFIRTDFIILNLIIYGNILFQGKLSIISLRNNLLKNDSKRSNNFLFLFSGSILGYILVTFHNYTFTKKFFTK